MWVCKNCGEELEDQFDACWQCGSLRGGAQTTTEAKIDAASDEAATLVRDQSSVRYDPRLIVRYGEIMYAKAQWLVISSALIGCVLAGIVGSMVASATSYPAWGGAAFGGAVGLVVGAIYGEARAFWYRLTAQLVLCHLEIEKNTRRKQAYDSVGRSVGTKP